MNEQRFLTQIAQLKQREDIDTAVLDTITHWVQKADISQRIRITPYHISLDAHLSLEAVVSHLLQAVDAGIFDLNWDIHCPHCDMIANQYNNLSQVTELYYCRMCEKEFEGELNHRIEATFSLNKEIEDLQLPPVCPPPPSITPLFSMPLLAAGETMSAQETLTADVYKLNCPITLSIGTLIVEGEPTDEVQEFAIRQLPNNQFDIETIRARPGPIRLTLTNDAYPLSGMWAAPRDLPIIRPEDLPLRLSGLELIHFPMFRQLFGNQVLSDRERLKITAVTTLFTDITGSTPMYERLGNPIAYNIVRDHFDILFEAIAQHGGTVIKTIGDAVMASFIQNDQALCSILTALARIRQYNQQRNIEEQVCLKIGLHRGAAILVNLNQRLDYFGSTINKAARIQSLSGSNQVSFSEAIYQDKGFQKILTDLHLDRVQPLIANLKGIEGEQCIYQITL